MLKKQETINAVEEAKNDLEKEKQDKEKKQKEKFKLKVKQIVRDTLQKIEDIEKEVKGGQDKIAILKKDLKDIESGRLDLIEDRQTNNETAKCTSIIYIEKIKEIEKKKKERDRWPDIWPTYPPPVYPTWPPKPWYEPYWIGDRISSNPITGWIDGSSISFCSNGSDLSMMAQGTYMLDSGKSVDIRPTK